MSLVIALVALIVFCLIGIPIPYALGLTGLSHITAMNEPRLFSMFTQRFFTGADSFTLLAIPLFILAGELMATSGITESLGNFAKSLVGHIRGGLAYCTIVLGIFLGAILGSANASAAILATQMYPILKEEGYDDIFSNLLIGAVAIIGPIIPPSLVFVVYGATVGVSIGELFIAGIGPGLLLALVYSIFVWWQGRKKNWPSGQRAPVKEILKSFLKAIPAFTVPVLILGGILGGIMTPTESAGGAVAITIFLGLFVYRKLKIKDIMDASKRAALITGSVMLLTVCGMSLGWTLALDQAPNTIGGFVMGITSNKYTFLLLVNIILLIIGTVMEPIAGIIVFVPVLLPLIGHYGISPVHFGIIVSINLIIGMLTPPVMEVVYVASMITKTPFAKLVNPAWVWTGIAFAALLLVTYIPAISMFLVKVLT
jgi:tripartite ATP-independent transporter DctM subunit